MIRQLTGVPANMVAFSAEGEVTEDDFKSVVFPAVEKLVTRTGELNYLMVINTPLTSFKAGAWLQDAVLGLKQLTNWNRVAILSDSEAINTFTNIFSVLVPGEFKGYEKTKLDEAVEWVSGG
ncbi:STAS/SEC14 domain-containing protein [Sediminibacterium roseum]|uniref:STAS/SEC14 domain-containing protein n=1 Tax=Sediminibacterium roseum TaxID=1978412 RepID=A0ABW9ZQY0_9BACT|nr:STAS/SEC14 domain-containing protein [Sediminibacterium roseum]NCI49514.1 STAS/SEC14 domain-containing protein [Sediminibacterium roseum]